MFLYHEKNKQNPRESFKLLKMSTAFFPLMSFGKKPTNYNIIYVFTYKYPSYFSHTICK